MKKRFTLFDPIRDFYNSPEGRNKSLADGKSNDLIQMRYKNKINQLTKLGFKENINADVTGGDHDYIVIDNKNKEWCWWENGFYPFSGQDLPTNHTLKYWANHRQ